MVCTSDSKRINRMECFFIVVRGRGGGEGCDESHHCRCSSRGRNGTKNSLYVVLHGENRRGTWKTSGWRGVSPKPKSIQGNWETDTPSPNGMQGKTAVCLVGITDARDWNCLFTSEGVGGGGDGGRRSVRSKRFVRMRGATVAGNNGSQNLSLSPPRFHLICDGGSFGNEIKMTGGKRGEGEREREM